MLCTLISTVPGFVVKSLVQLAPGALDVSENERLPVSPQELVSTHAGEIWPDCPETRAPTKLVPAAPPIPIVNASKSASRSNPRDTLDPNLSMTQAHARLTVEIPRVDVVLTGERAG